MRLYERWVLPGLLDLAMRNRALDRFRRQAVGSAHGTVLEIGVGSGLNLALYGATVDRVVAIDPSPELLRRAGRHIAEARMPVPLVRTSAEHLPFADAVFDGVVMTWTLCSIPDPAAALAETRRVLRPGGVLAFVEHGLAPTPGVARWQHRLTPYWRPVAGGCHLNRGIDELIRAAGFRLEFLETGYIAGPKPWTFMYQGRATA